MSDTTAPGEGAQADKKSEFTPITNQDELNKAIAGRLERERAKFSDYFDLKTKASKYDELEASQKSEIQNATERAEAAERALQEKSSEALRFAVIAKHAIPAEYQDFVSGADEDELEAKAQKVLSLIPSTTSDQSHVRELFIPGEGRSPANPAAGDPAQQFADALRRASNR